MINCTETPFICVSKIQIIGIDIEDEGWFLGMLILAFALQISANFIWLRNSQISREILQYKSGDPGRGPLICKSVGWTALSTVVWIFRVMFIIGNNLWLYLVILLGNVIGTCAASYVQSEDEDNTLKTIVEHLEHEEFKELKLRLTRTIQKTMNELDKKTETSAQKATLPENNFIY
jgi:hypothetical protein